MQPPPKYPRHNLAGSLVTSDNYFHFWLTKVNLKIIEHICSIFKINFSRCPFPTSVFGTVQSLQEAEPAEATSKFVERFVRCGKLDGDGG